jgi:hypothetical protein
MAGARNSERRRILEQHRNRVLRIESYSRNGIVLGDGYGKPRLIMGVREYSYLVTSGNYDGNPTIGPTRCGQSPVGERTNLFDDGILGLAQVRSELRSQLGEPDLWDFPHYLKCPSPSLPLVSGIGRT